MKHYLNETVAFIADIHTITKIKVSGERTTHNKQNMFNRLLCIVLEYDEREKRKTTTIESHRGYVGRPIEGRSCTISCLRIHQRWTTRFESDRSFSSLALQSADICSTRVDQNSIVEIDDNETRTSIDLYFSAKDFVDCIDRIRFLSWLLIGSLTHAAITRNEGTIICHPIPVDASQSIADYILYIITGFADQSKTSVIHMSSLFHSFILCQVREHTQLYTMLSTNIRRCLAMDDVLRTGQSRS
jgi:hypothetical protein